MALRKSLEFNLNHKVNLKIFSTPCQSRRICSSSGICGTTSSSNFTRFPSISPSFSSFKSNQSNLGSNDKSISRRNPVSLSHSNQSLISECTRRRVPSSWQTQRSIFTSSVLSLQQSRRNTNQKESERVGSSHLSSQTNSTTQTTEQAGSQSEANSTSTSAPPPASKVKAITEDIRTIPNLLTLARIASTPFLGYMILIHDMKSATILLFFAGFTDWLDGYLARRWNSYTVFGSIADPAADKILMTTMVVCLAKGGLMPLPLAVIILGRDVALIISAFIIRYKSLPPPRTFSRYWDFTLPSASVHPTQLSKYNTFLQLLLVGTLTVLPVCPTDLQEIVTGYPLDSFMGLVALTTIASGMSYLGGGGARKVASEKFKGGLKQRLEKGMKEIARKKKSD